MTKVIYAGSFDPITNGHIDIVNRAKKLFDEVYIGVIHNPDKQALFTIDERIQLIQKVFEDDSAIVVEGFKGLLVDYARQKNVFTFIRGLRAVSDFDFEFQMSHTNRSLESKMETVFLMTDTNYSYLSSSLVKQLASLGGDLKGFVPLHIGEALGEKYHV